MADEKLSLSLDDIITKNKKPDRPAKAAAGAGRGPRRGAAAKSDGPGPAGGNKARALAVAVGKATKRTGAAPRRNSGGAPQRRVEVVELAEVRAILSCTTEITERTEHSLSRQGSAASITACMCL